MRREHRSADSGRRCDWRPALLLLFVLASKSLAAEAVSTVGKTNRTTSPDSAGSTQAPPETCGSVEALQAWISNRISQPKYDHAYWGIKIESLDTGASLFEHNSGKLFSPASNTKLFTVAAVLDRLGPDYRIQTSLLSRSKPDASGDLKDNLTIYGRGDPTRAARFYRGNLSNALTELVNALTNAGVHQVSGDLVGDQSFFRGPEYGSGWTWDDLEHNYGAEVSALSINDNVVRVEVQPGAAVRDPCRLKIQPPCSFLLISNQTTTLAAGEKRTVRFYRPPGTDTLFITGGMPVDGESFSEPVTVHQPARLFLECFRRAAEEAGVKIEGSCRVSGQEADSPAVRSSALIELGAANSLPLKDIIRTLEKISHNLYADLLLAHLGERARAAQESDELTSEELGVRELKRFLTQVGIGPEEYYFEEGSGLSRDTLVSPNATMGLLKFMSRHRHAKVFVDALPVAGVDGTLRNRMKETAAAGKLQAKTGSLRWTRSLSGYVTSAAGERLAFCLMLNRYNPPAQGSGSEDLDAIAAQLAGFTGKSK